ncbi:hypothetical protein [Vallitalea guaymasensis]|uniref:hypothetical protein n=1 Tax=Vallitalea guaymasensis TaxID=1185412 RepID=UPI0023568739|nr:hypothetical protein [Vallitalea guaymasensis]
MIKVSTYLTKLASLISERNTINEKAKRVLNTPFLLGNIGEFVCGNIFDIRLNDNRSHKGFDGVFVNGKFKGKSVNIKFYSKNDYILDLKNQVNCDYYLVLTGSKGTDNWNISDVYLFNTEELLNNLSGFNVKIGVATSVRKVLWIKVEFIQDLTMFIS